MLQCLKANLGVESAILTLLYGDIILVCVVLLNIKQMQPEAHGGMGSTAPNEC